MSKMATKARENTWCQARYNAAKYNDRFASREGAAEETGIERTRLAKIELGTLTPYPEEALLMADAYHAPELRNAYCREYCPLGSNMPKVENADLDRLTIRALDSMRKIKLAKELLLDITADGVISKAEEPEMQQVISLLDELAEINQNLKIWFEKNKED